MFHRNAPLTPEGRRRLCERVDAGRPICHVAVEAGIARQTLGRWYARWTEQGEDGLEDRSSRPHASPNQTSAEVEERVVALRREHKVGPVQLVGKLAEEHITLPASTIPDPGPARHLPAARRRRGWRGPARARGPLRMGSTR